MRICLNLLQEQESPDPDAIKLALTRIRPPPQTSKSRAGRNQEAVDAELLQVYLEEAEEVLERIRQNLDTYATPEPG
jgi:hypothetical protein